MNLNLKKKIILIILINKDNNDEFAFEKAKK